ncbi:MAG: ABC transporter substrate-binding protein [Patescibacteria group bacterium]|nr:ABC transporter substrate-binding protein [Patescibacteria group bacterium]
MPRILNSFSSAKMPTFSQWRHIGKLLSSNERMLLGILLVLFVVSFITLTRSVYVEQTEIVPKRGGEMVEGIVGSPRFINPLYGSTQDVDRDLVQLIFSGIMKYGEDGEVVNDLAKNVTVENGGKTIIVNLKENVFWHDEKPFTSDDIVFTVQALKDSAYKSPVRANWVGVEVLKVSELRVRFELREPYAPFIERLTLPILPAHIWENISPEKAALSLYNLQPIGTGPYKIASSKRSSEGNIIELRLRPNLNYYEQIPYIQSIVLRFYETEEKLIEAAQKGQVHNLTLSSTTLLARIRTGIVHELALPRYFALFFNVEADIVEKQSIRDALALSLDKERIVKEVFGEYGIIVNSPLPSHAFNTAEIPTESQDITKATALIEDNGYTKEEGVFVKTFQETSGSITSNLQRGSQGAQVRSLQECLAKDPEVYPLGTVNGVFGPSTQAAVISFQEKYAEDVLQPTGLTKGTGTVGPSTRAKLDELCFNQPSEQISLAIELVTLNQTIMLEIAEKIKEQWSSFGVDVKITSFSVSELERDIIKPRNYQVLLFGEILSIIPDPFPFWHSSQVKDPGLNLSVYDNKQADRLLEQIRREMDEEERIGLYNELQAIVLKDTPAIFLYDEPFLYITNSNIHGTLKDDSVIADPSKRFSNIANWYIKTKRTFK